MRNTQFCACVAAIPDLHKRYQRRHAGRTQVHLRDHHPPATDRWKQKAHQVVKYATRLHTSYARAFIRIHFSRVVMWTAPESPLHTFVLKLNIFTGWFQSTCKTAYPRLKCTNVPYKCASARYNEHTVVCFSKVQCSSFNMSFRPPVRPFVLDFSWIDLVAKQDACMETCLQKLRKRLLVRSFLGSAPMN
jgi:hypothetical protein